MPLLRPGVLPEDQRDPRIAHAIREVYSTYGDSVQGQFLAYLAGVT